MKKAVVILNEQHSLMEEQEEILNEKYDSWEIYTVPASGWTLEEQKEQANMLSNNPADKIMNSPIPFLLMQLSNWFGANYEMPPGTPLIFRGNLFIFHNDKRDKRELPDGKIINVVSRTGWQLVTAV